MLDLGDVTIRRVVEEEGPLFDPLGFFPTLTPELLAENRAWLEPAALDPATGELVLCVQSFLVRTPHHLVLVDSCVGNDKPRPGRPQWHMRRSAAWPRALAAAGVGVEEVDVVLCTHLHVDHVGWNTRLLDGRWVPTFPNARYVFSAAEWAHWQAEHARTPIPCIADSVLPVIEAGRAKLVRNDFAVDDYLRLLATPGHTPDHCAVQVGRPGAEAIITGDLIHSPLQARYPALSMRADHDPAQAAATRRGFLEHACEAGTAVCVSHFPSPSIGRFVRWGEGFRLACDAAEVRAP